MATAVKPVSLASLPQTTPPHPPGPLLAVLLAQSNDAGTKWTNNVNKMYINFTQRTGLQDYKNLQFMECDLRIKYLYLPP